MTLRELLEMAEARRRDEWDRTAATICHLVNIQIVRGHKMKLQDVHPFMAGAKSDGPIATGRDLQAIFGGVRTGPTDRHRK